MRRFILLISLVFLLVVLTACELFLLDKINLEYNTYNDDGSVKIQVYVNDTLMDVKVFADDYEIVGPYNLSNYTIAAPILDYLGIDYEISKDETEIVFDSEEYGEMKFTYVGSLYRENVTMIDGEIQRRDGQLYLPFWVFRVYTNGSLKQDDSHSMYLYTGDYERKDLPTTLEECYVMLDNLLSPFDKYSMKNATETHLAIQHMNLGLWIRNNWLYPQSKLAKLLNERGVEHTDSMSSLIMQGYVKYLNGQPCSLEDLLDKGID